LSLLIRQPSGIRIKKTKIKSVCHVCGKVIPLKCFFAAFPAIAVWLLLPQKMKKKELKSYAKLHFILN